MERCSTKVIGRARVGRVRYIISHRWFHVFVIFFYSDANLLKYERMFRKFLNVRYLILTFICISGFFQRTLKVSQLLLGTFYSSFNLVKMK